MTVVSSSFDRYRADFDTATGACKVTGGRFCASLEHLSAHSTLVREDSNATHIVPAWVIGRIEAWVAAQRAALSLSVPGR